MDSVPSSINQYNVDSVIGHGSFSSVYKVFDIEKKQIFAMKVFPKSNLEDEGDQQRFQREINAMAFMKHDNLVQLHDFFWDENNFYMIMDFCQEGELFDYIVDHDKLSEPVAAYVFRQIVEATAFCHSYGVAHRDLKPENVLIDKFPHVKVSDFGLCGFISDSKLMKTFCGSPCYCAPECLCRIQYDGRLADVWSLGVILYSMVTGEHPWVISNTNLMLRQILKGKYDIPSYLSPECRDLINGMLQLNTSERMTLDRVAKHPWFKNANSIPQGKYLPPDLSLPPLQPISLQELSEASAKSSTRSDCGIYNPFDAGREDELTKSHQILKLDNNDDVLEDGDEDDDYDDINNGHRVRFSNSQLPLLKMNYTASMDRIPIKKIEAKRIAPRGLRIGQNRQKSSSLLVFPKLKPTSSKPMSVIEE